MPHEKVPAILTKTHIILAIVVNILVVISSIVGTVQYLIPKMISYHVSELIENKYQPKWESEFGFIRVDMDKSRQERVKELDAVISTVEKLSISNDLSHVEIRVDLRAIYTTLLSISERKAVK